MISILCIEDTKEKVMFLVQPIWICFGQNIDFKNLYKKLNKTECKIILHFYKCKIHYDEVNEKSNSIFLNNYHHKLLKYKKTTAFQSIIHHSSLPMATIRELSRLIRDHGHEEVWITHYSSKHPILLVGEGDFSFSCSLAARFRSASNICASSLDSYGTLWDFFRVNFLWRESRGFL